MAPVAGRLCAMPHGAATLSGRVWTQYEKFKLTVPTTQGLFPLL
jgi:hypothetical protein